MLLTLMLSTAAWTMLRDRRLALTSGALMLVALGTAACGGLAKDPNGATPPGTYNLTLTAMLNGQTQTQLPDAGSEVEASRDVLSASCGAGSRIL